MHYNEQQKSSQMIHMNVITFFQGIRTWLMITIIPTTMEITAMD